MIGQLAIEMDLITDVQLAEALAEQMGLQTVKLEELTLNDVIEEGDGPSVSEQMVTRAYTWFGPLQDMQAVANETGVCLKLAKDFVGYYLPGAA